MFYHGEADYLYMSGESVVGSSPIQKEQTGALFLPFQGFSVCHPPTMGGRPSSLSSFVFLAWWVFCILNVLLIYVFGGGHRRWLGSVPHYCPDTKRVNYFSPYFNLPPIKLEFQDSSLGGVFCIFTFLRATYICE